jgi:cytochrome c oxidase subunit 2
MPFSLPAFRPSPRSLAWLLLALAALAAALAPLPAPAASPVERVFHLEASSFEYAPGVLNVNPGDRVTIELTATDVVHGLYLDGYGLNLEADPGKTERITFTADRPGSFRFRCSVTCGALHPFMIGKLQVGDNTLLWRAVALALLGLAAVLFWGRK